MAALHRVEILGAGPGGLYAAILLRRAFPDVHVRVTEQNPADATWGFGVVFSDQALGFLKADDPETHDLIAPEMERWRNMTLDVLGERVTLDGIGFSAIGRLHLLRLLQERARALGVEMRFDTTVTDLDALAQGADLLIGADGLNSAVRLADPDAFDASLDLLNNRFAWFGTPRAFDTLTQTFIETPHGPMNAHHYRYAPDMSTFIVECDAATFAAAGFETMDEATSATTCAALFADALDGAPLLTNRSLWRRFPRLWCRNWVAGRRVLLGDAAHTAHFSIGSGTRLAMEDAIALVAALKSSPDIDTGLAAYQDSRPPVARKIVDAANTSCLWYEDFGSRLRQPALDFAFDYITRSGRIDMDRLRALSPEFMARYEAHAARRGGEPPLIDPVDTPPGAQLLGFDKAQHRNCAEILWQNLARNPDKPAVISPAGSLTYAQLCAEAARWGNAFASWGLRRGERIAFLLDDTPVYPAAFFGAVRAGFVPVLLNTQSTPDLLGYFLSDSGARLALCDAGFAGLIDALPEGGPLEQAILTNADTPPGTGWTAAETFLAGQPDTLEPADTGPDDMAFWMYSSGSTGRPKGIVHLHHDMAYTQASFGERVLKLRPDDICFSVPKVFFAYGFGNAFTFPFSVGATALLLPGRFEAPRVLDAIARHRPTVFFALPTVYTALCRAEGADSADLSSLRKSVSAAEILSEEVAARWRALTGLTPIEGLGSTEMLHIYLSNTEDDPRPGAAGTPVPGYEVRLLDPDGRPVPPGGEGVMEVRGHSSAPCYWNRPDKTRETMRGDWIHTGDRFTERDGYYYFLGRADDLIKVSGQWVWPLEVERCLNEHPFVHECAVLAQEMADRRMTLRAVVRLRDGIAADATTTRTLQEHAKTQLLPHKYPRIIDYVPELPKTGTGKIDRQALTTPTPASA